MRARFHRRGHRIIVLPWMAATRAAMTCEEQRTGFALVGRLLATRVKSWDGQARGDID